MYRFLQGRYVTSQLSPITSRRLAKLTKLRRLTNNKFAQIATCLLLATERLLHPH